MRRTAGQKISIAGRRHPPRAGKMGLPRSERPLRLLLGIYVQDDPGHVAPVRIFSRRVEQADVGEQPLLVISSQDRSIRSDVGDIGIEQRLSMAHTLRYDIASRCSLKIPLRTGTVTRVEFP